MEDTDYMMKQKDHDIELYEENEGRKILREFLIAEIKSKSQDEDYFADYNFSTHRITAQKQRPFNQSRRCD